MLFSPIAASVADAAGVPSILSYQGRLADSSGNLLGGSGTTYYLKFSLWSSPTVGSGSRVWPVSAPSSVSSTVRQGVFTVNIGDTANGYPDALNYAFNASTIYLQVEVSSDNVTFETLSPRQQISSAAYAQVAGGVSGLTQSSIGTTTPAGNAVLTVEATSSSAIPLLLRGVTGQSVNLFQMNDGSGASIFSVGATGLATLANLLLNGSTTLQNFSFVNAAGTNATTTALFSSVASSTNLFSQTAALGTLTLGTALGIANGGTNATGYTQGTLLAYNGTSFVSTTTIGNSQLQNSMISGITLGNNLNSLSTNSTLSGTSYNGSAAVSNWGLNLGNSNWWTATQNFTNASTSQLTATSSVWFTGVTASSLLALDSNQKLVATTSIGNSLLSNSGALTINTSAPLSGGGSVALGGTLTLACATCSAWPFTTGLINFGTSTQATTTPEWFQMGLFASSTSQFAAASSTQLTVSDGTWFSGITASSLLAVDNNQKLIATSSIGMNLLSGVLPIANGGTNANTQTTNGITYFDGTRITSGSQLFFNGTQFAVGTTTPFWNLTIASSTGPQIALTDTTAGSNAWTLRSVGNFFYLATSTATATSSTSAFYIDQNAIAYNSNGFISLASSTIQKSLTINQGNASNNYALNITNIGGGTDGINLSASGGGSVTFDNFNANINPQWNYNNRHAVWNVSNNGNGAAGTPAFQFQHVNDTNSIVTFAIKGQASQTGDQFRIIDSSSNVLFYVSAGGQAGIGTSTASTTAQLAVSTSTKPQLALTDASASSFAWTMRSVGNYFYLATSTYSATSTVSALTINPNGDLIIHGSSGTDCTIGNGASATNCSSSDARLKDNITTLTATSGLAAIMRLDPVSFDWNAGMIANNAPTSTQFGFIAQQVKDIFPNLVYSHENGLYTLDYQGLAAPMVKALQELDLQVAPITSATSSPSEITSGAASSTAPWIASFADAPQSLKDGINGLADTLVHVFKNTVYAATGVFNTIFAREVHTDKLCVSDGGGETCITRSQLSALLTGAAAGASTAPPPERSHASADATAGDILPVVPDTATTTSDTAAPPTDDTSTTTNATSSSP